MEPLSAAHNGSTLMMVWGLFLSGACTNLVYIWKTSTRCRIAVGLRNIVAECCCIAEVDRLYALEVSINGLPVLFTRPARRPDVVT